MVQLGGAGLSHFYGRGKAGAGREGGHSELGVRGEAVGVGGGAGSRGWGGRVLGGTTTVPAPAGLHDVCRRELGDGRRFPFVCFFRPLHSLSFPLSFP